MNIKNYIKIACAASLAVLASPIVNAMTNEEKEYLNLYGMVIAEQTGVKQLALTSEEVNAVMDGMKAYASGKAFPENAPVIGPKMQEYLQQRAEKLLKESASKTEAESGDFWKKIADNQKIQKSPSGLAYEIIELGAAPMPTENSTVSVNYTGTLVNGKEFDSSKKMGKPVEFPLNGVILGFKEGLQKIGKGGKIRLYVPAKLGYGDQPVGEIPGGSTLIFDVEMVDVK